uniref:Lysozyme n=1 Tax=Riptortus pedestris TaxID=329032 RepID=R4WMM0_RIPPE|nr:unknown secreted protein [Riptortus pedestris]
MKILLFVLGCLTCQVYSYVNKVVDLSHWNNVNMRLAQEDGIVGVIHKATQGEDYIDPTYQKRREQAEKLGLLWGAYHFGSGSNLGQVQADHFLRTVGNHTNVLLVLDLEPNGSNTMSIEQAGDFVLRVLEVTGRYPLIYGSPYFLSSYTGKLDVLRECKLWIAHYTDNASPILPNGSNSWLFWQYTDGGRGGTPRLVKGIGPCDRDRFNGEEEDLINKWPHF